MKKRATGFVLLLEIIAICVLHAVKINQAAPLDVQSATKTITPQQKEAFLHQLAFNK